MSIKVGKSFKALIAAGAALVMAASMAACGPSAGTPSEAKSSDTGTSSSANAKARSLDEIKKSGKIKIAVFSDKAPFGYVDKDGKYQGYDVYFAEQLAKDLGVEPEYTSVDPAARVDVLTSNKVDLVLAWAKSNKGFKVGITHLGDDDTIAPAVQKGNTELLNFVNDEIVKLGKDNFFHKDYQETLEPVYGNEVNPDDIVVEGGAV